jgi:hypothetical protein
MQQATHNAAVGRCLVVAGVVFLAYRTSTHPLAWQVSLSHWGRPPVVVSRHQIKRDAKAQVARVRRICRTRDLRDVAVFAALIQELAAFSDGTVE